MYTHKMTASHISLVKDMSQEPQTCTATDLGVCGSSEDLSEQAKLDAGTMAYSLS